MHMQCVLPLLRDYISNAQKGELIQGRKSHFESFVLFYLSNKWHMIRATDCIEVTEICASTLRRIKEQEGNRTQATLHMFRKKQVSI